MGWSGLKKRADKSDSFFCFKQLFFFGMAVISTILAIVALTQLQAVVNDVDDVLDNWETKPVVEVITVSSDQACPDDFTYYNITADLEEFSRQGLQSFPGVKKGHCVCPAEAAITLIDSTYTSCDSSQASAGCVNVPPIDGDDFAVWRGAKLCYRRGGEPQVTFGSHYKRRPRPDLKNGVYTCPNGYQMCGDGSYDDTYAICFPDDEVCPYTSLIISDSPPTGDGYEAIESAAFVDGFTLYGRRAYPLELPIVDLKVALTKVSAPVDLEAYNGGTDNSRGPCYEGSPQKLKSAFSYYTTTGIVNDIRPDYPTQCRTVDRRYHLLDVIGQEDLMLGNYQLNAVCQNSDLKSLTDPTYLSTNDPDYQQSGIPCNPDPAATVDTQCSFQPGFTCLATDVICETTTKQTKCGVLAHVAHELTSESTTWGWYGRGEIIWIEECEPETEPLEHAHEPLKATVAAQTVAVVVSCIANALLGIVIPFAAVRTRFGGKKPCCSICCCCFCGAFTWAGCLFTCCRTEEKQVEACRRRWDTLLKLSKVVTIAVVIGHLDRIRIFYSLLGNKDCSDGLTNHTFEYLGEELPNIFLTSLANLVLDGVMLLGACFMVIRARRKARQAPQAGLEMQDTMSTSNASPAPSPDHPKSGQITFIQPRSHAIPIQGQPVYIATVVASPQHNVHTTPTSR